MKIIPDHQTQTVVIVDVIASIGADEGQFEALIFTSSRRVNCEICGAEFERPLDAKTGACSPACKRERRRRYQENYRRRNREMRIILRKRFGDRAPTDDEALDFFGDCSRDG